MTWKATRNNGNNFGINFQADIYKMDLQVLMVFKISQLPKG